MQIRMRGGVDGGLEERLEEVLDDVLEAGDLVVQLVDVIQAGDLDQPQRVVRHPRRALHISCKSRG